MESMQISASEAYVSFEMNFREIGKNISAYRNRVLNIDELMRYNTQHMEQLNNSIYKSIDSNYGRSFSARCTHASERTKSLTGKVDELGKNYGYAYACAVLDALETPDTVYSDISVNCRYTGVRIWNTLCIGTGNDYHMIKSRIMY